MHLITGVAGFIGSNLAKDLLRQGERVIGIDCFTDYYSRSLKENNIKDIINDDNFVFIENDLNRLNLLELLTNYKIKYVYHQAAQAGVRASWGDSFRIYTENNITATQRLLEAATQYGQLEKFVYASSSSVYGDTDKLPMQENNRLQPVSPYGVSKLAAENLCYLYWKNFGLPTLSLRYFTVFGEGQRPDMAFHIFIKAILNKETLKIFGDGKQSRNFTYVADVVKANILAARSEHTGEVFNIGGNGEGIILNDAIVMMEEIIGETTKIVYDDKVKGDVKHTAADCNKAAKLLGYSSKVAFATGLEREIDWLRNIYRG